MRYDSITKIESICKINDEVGLSKIKEQLNVYREKYGLNLESGIWEGDGYWSIERSRRYLEYIMRGGKEGKDIYFNMMRHESGASLMCIDGRKRLIAIENYLNNIDNYTLFGGHYWREFSEEDEKVIDEKVKITIHINELSTRKEMINWYIDLNYANFSDEDMDKVNNLLLTESMKEVGEKELVILETGTNRRVTGWEYSGDFIRDKPPQWIREYYIVTGKTYCGDNGIWYETKSKQEMKRGYYIKRDKGISVFEDKGFFNEYYKILETIVK